MRAFGGPFDGAYVRDRPRPEMAWISRGPRRALRVSAEYTPGAHCHVLEPAGTSVVLDCGAELVLTAYRYRYVPAACCPGCGGTQALYQDARPEGGDVVRVRIQHCQYCGSLLDGRREC